MSGEGRKDTARAHRRAEIFLDVYNDERGFEGGCHVVWWLSRSMEVTFSEDFSLKCYSTVQYPTFFECSVHEAITCLEDEPQQQVNQGLLIQGTTTSWKLI